MMILDSWQVRDRADLSRDLGVSRCAITKAMCLPFCFLAPRFTSVEAPGRSHSRLRCVPKRNVDGPPRPRPTDSSLSVYRCSQVEKQPEMGSGSECGYRPVPVDSSAESILPTNRFLDSAQPQRPRLTPPQEPLPRTPVLAPEYAFLGLETNYFIAAF